MMCGSVLYQRLCLHEHFQISLCCGGEIYLYGLNKKKMSNFEIHKLLYVIDLKVISVIYFTKVSDYLLSPLDAACFCLCLLQQKLSNLNPDLFS